MLQGCRCSNVSNRSSIRTAFKKTRFHHEMFKGRSADRRLRGGLRTGGLWADIEPSGLSPVLSRSTVEPS